MSQIDNNMREYGTPYLCSEDTMCGKLERNVTPVIDSAADSAGKFVGSIFGENAGDTAKSVVEFANKPLSSCAWVYDSFNEDTPDEHPGMTQKAPC